MPSRRMASFHSGKNGSLLNRRSQAFLQRAFNLVGFPLLGNENPNIPEGHIQILVGNKP
jgi:hypothetical protein